MPHAILLPLLHSLQDLLDSLRRDQYGIGIGECKAAQGLLLRVLEQDQPLTLPPTAEDDALRQEAEQRLQGMLGALLCRNASEQARFPAHFQAWLDEQNGSAGFRPRGDPTPPRTLFG